MAIWMLYLLQMVKERFLNKYSKSPEPPGCPRMLQALKRQNGTKNFF